jgi:hypothetical protein
MLRLQQQVSHHVCVQISSSTKNHKQLLQENVSGCHMQLVAWLNFFYMQLARY